MTVLAGGAPSGRRLWQRELLEVPRPEYLRPVFSALRCAFSSVGAPASLLRSSPSPSVRPITG